MGWPSPNGMTDSEWNGRVRMSWPNHPGRVRISRRNILAESDWLAETSWPSELWQTPSELRPSELGRIRVAWPSELGRIRVVWPNHHGRVRVVWPSELGRIRVVWPSELGRIRVSWPSELGRIRVVSPWITLAESD